MDFTVVIRDVGGPCRTYIMAGYCRMNRSSTIARGSCRNDPAIGRICPQRVVDGDDRIHGMPRVGGVSLYLVLAEDEIVAGALRVDLCSGG